MPDLQSATKVCMFIRQCPKPLVLWTYGGFMTEHREARAWLCRRSFAGRLGLYCERMQALGDFGAQHCVDHAMPIYSALAREDFRHHFYGKVSFTRLGRLARPRNDVRVTRMLG